MIGRWFVAVFVGLACSAPPVAAQVVFDASPTVKVESDDAKTTRFMLSKKERMEYRVTIILRDGRYYWASRENRELVHQTSGAFHYFIATDGAGYVKVFDTSDLGALRAPGPKPSLPTWMRHRPPGSLA